MSSAPYSPASAPAAATAARPSGERRLATLSMWAALAIFGAHTIYTLATGLWQGEDHAYSPFILAIALYLIWRQRAAIAALPARGSAFGLGLLIVAVVANLLGTVLGNITVEAGSIWLAGIGMLAFVIGWRAVRLLGYPLATAAFCLPLPGSVIAAVTFPLKMAVSGIAARIIALMGLPIERQGVLIELGNYRLLVADACSGLQSMFSLAAAVIVYLALMEHRSMGRSGILIAAILPIALLANVIRVLALALITYYFGDAAGQGFLHGFAGILMFLVAFAAVMSLDSLLGVIHPKWDRA